MYRHNIHIEGESRCNSRPAVLTNARLGRGRRCAGPRRARDRGRPDRLGRRDADLPAAYRAAADRPARAAWSRPPDRLPHPSGPRRPPRARVRDAARRARATRRSRAPAAASSRPSRRRGRRARTTCWPRRCRARCAAGRGRGDLSRSSRATGSMSRPNSHAARRPPAGGRCARSASHQLPRRPCGARRIRGRADAYLDEVCLPALRAAHAEGLVDAVDGFCEGIAFTPPRSSASSTARARWACR
jgi:hypothetical protein